MRLFRHRVLPALLLWMLILGACSPGIASSQPAPGTLPPSDTPFAFPTTSIPDPIRTVGTPHIDQPPDGWITTAPPDSQNCGYQWAYQDLPELSSSFQQSIRALQPEAQATAFAFGENCVLPDGNIARFIPMETDFNVTLQVDASADEATLGEWIVKVMQVIDNIPAEQIVGPRPGRVTITFQSGRRQGGVNFYRDQYRALPSGLSHAEIYQALQPPQ